MGLRPTNNLSCGMSSDRKRKNSETDFEFKATIGHSPQSAGKQGGNLTESSFHPRARIVAEGAQNARHCPFGVRLTRDEEGKAGALLEQVFPVISGVSRRGVESGTCWHVERERFDGPYIRRRPRGEHELEGLARGCQQERKA